MEISDQIIKVLDNLAARLGVVVDWTSANVLPKVTELCAKYIKWEITTSIVWLIAAVIVLILGIRGVYKVIQLEEQSHKCGLSDTEEVVQILHGFAAILGIVAILVILKQSFDIVKCITFPELQIFQYIKSLSVD